MTKSKSQKKPGSSPITSNATDSDKPVKIVAMEPPGHTLLDFSGGTMGTQPEQPQGEGQATPVPEDQAAAAPEGQPSPSAQTGGQPGEINHGDLFDEPLETLRALGQGEYQELRLCSRRMVEHYWKFGQIVTAIKQRLGHGEFIEFCRSQSSGSRLGAPLDADLQ